MTPEEVELLSELTIVIPTCNRPLELERAIEYWRDTPITVHIVDGSEKPWFEVGSLQNIPTITYHHLPRVLGEENMDSYFRRLRFATTLPTTKYTALCADDDFFTVSGLVKACSLMNSDQNVDAIVGICSEFKLSDDDKEMRWHLRYADWRSGIHSRSDDLSLRLLDESGAFYLYYSVMRAEPWKKTVSSAFQMTNTGDFFYELAMNYFGTAFCKTSVERHIFWIKSSWALNPNIPGQATRIRDADWFRDKKNRHLVKRFEHHMRSVFASIIQGPTSEKIASDLAKKLIQRISKKSETRKYRKIKGKILKFIVRIFTPFPNYIKLLVNRFLPNNLLVATGAKPGILYPNLTRNNYLTLSDFLRGLAETDITFDSKDFDTISKLLLKPRDELRLHANL